MVKVKEQLSIENRLRKNDSYTKEPFCELCDCGKSVAKCKQKIENEANPCRLAKGRLYYNSNCKAVSEVQEFDIEIINERGETQFVKLDDKKSKGQLWFINALEGSTKFIERDTTVIIDYLLSERRKGNVKFKEITARPLNAWRKDNKKSKAIELNLSVVNGAVSILSTESVSGFVGGGKTIGMEDNNTNVMQVAESGKDKGNELAEMVEKSANLITPKLYVNGSSAVNSKLTAPSPTETLLSLRRPYWSINDMPYDYLFKKVYGWICSLTDCILEPIAQMDEDGKPIMEEYQYMGETKQRPKITYNEKYVYKSVPTLSGLAIAIGVSLSSLTNYFNMSTEPNNRNKLIDKSSIDTNSIEFQIYNNIYNNTNDNITSVNNTNNNINNNTSNNYKANNTYNNTNTYNTTTSNAYNINAYNTTTSNNYNTNNYYTTSNAYNTTSKDTKLEIIKRARAEIDNFHEKRLGLNENVSGSMMYLFNSKALEDGGTWSNNHSVTVEAGQSILGRVLSGEELDRLAESSTADTAEVIDIEFKEDEENDK